MNFLRKGTAQRKNQSFAVHGSNKKRKTNFQSKDVPAKKSHRENLAGQPCKKWAEGTCPFGDKCYRTHDGPEGSDTVKKAPLVKAPGILPTPSIPVSNCHYCSTTGHTMKDCPDFKHDNAYNLGQAMHARIHANVSSPVMHEEDLPNDEICHHHDTPFQLKVLFVSLVASNLCWLPNFRRTLKSCVPTIVFFVVLAALALYALAAPAPSPSRYVRTSSYLNSEFIGVSTECEWQSDTGTHRFVTNSINDFIPDTRSVVYSPLTANVGGGTIITCVLYSCRKVNLDQGFHISTIMPTVVATLPQRFVAVDYLAVDLASATGAVISDEQKLIMLLDGFLPVFMTKSLRQLIQDKAIGLERTLTDAREAMHDFTNEEGLMTLNKGAPGPQRKTQTYNVESYCFENSDVKEDSGESMYVNAIPAYTIPIVEGEPPEDEEYTNLSVSLRLFVLPLLAANSIYFTGVGSNSRRILKSAWLWHRMRSLHHRYLPPIFTPTSTVHGRLNVPRDLQWESDYDWSRFVTNAVYDLIPGNVIFLPSSFVASARCEEKMCMEVPMEWRTSGVDAISGLKKSVHEPTAWGKSTDGLLAGGSTENYRFYSGHRQLDDMFAAGDPDRMVQERLSQTSPYSLEVKLKLTESINPTCITGVQIERVRGKSGWTNLHQTKYTTNFLKGHKTGSARPVDTPMNPGLARVLMEFPQDDFIKDFLKAFQIMVGVFTGRQTHVQFNFDIAVIQNSAPPFEILRCAEKLKGLF